MLPQWARGGKLSIPISRKHHLSLPSIPVALLFIGIGYLFALFTRPNSLGLSKTSYSSTSSPFLVDPKVFLSPPPVDRPSYIPASVEVKKNGMVVPDAVHYVYGLKPLPEGKQGEDLPYYAYLAMRSALINLRPKAIFFHYQHLPTGPWWDLIRPELILVPTQVPESIYGRKLDHFAHKADVIRLLAMKYSGGIYLDIDIYIIKPFDDLLYFPTTLGMEMSPDSRRNELDPEGLCNAIIISQPGSSFIDRWLASYDTFEGGEWARHSVQKPWEIARSHPAEVQVLNHKAFFWPMWHGEEIRKTHESTSHDFHQSGQYAYHAWESLAMGYLGNLSPMSIKENDNSFNRMAALFVGKDDEEVYKMWKGDV